MASTKSPEFSSTEMELKRRGRRRLIGAATIGLLGIVFLPMIFDGEPKSNRAGTNLKPQQISVQIPDKEGQPPLPAPTANATTAAPPAVEIAKSVPVEAPKPAPEVAPPVSPPAPVAAKAEKAKVVAKAAPQAVEKKGFVVQLGAFGDADKAKLAVATMKSAKLTVYTESIATNKGAVTRVRVGPFPTREKADSALAQVKLAGSDGKIVPLQ
jgi:DedD protein